MTKTFVIGDIHGCHKQLLEMVKQIKPDPQENRIVFLGDYINRGPDSKNVLTELMRLQREHPRTIFLKGNHEIMLLDFLAGKGHDLFFQAGGAATIKSYNTPINALHSFKSSFPDTHYRFLKNLLPYWSDDKFIYVHAGLEPGKHLTQQQPEWLYWAQEDEFIKTSFDLTKRIIFGHFPHKHPLIMKDKIGIDCGAVYGGHLACLVLPGIKIIKIKSPRYFP